jgi:hypothetical protein
MLERAAVGEAGGIPRDGYGNGQGREFAGKNLVIPPQRGGG